MSSVTIIYFVILILSIVLHEVAHGYAANSLGDPTARLAGRLTLNPIAHLDLVGSIILPALLVFSNSSIFFGWAKPVPYNPYNLRNQRFGEGAVALAGSATNILLALVFGLIVRFGATSLPDPALTIAWFIAFTNLFLGLFNLIPFPPLDGFTALRALLPWRLASSLHTFEDQVRRIGFLPLVLFLVLFSSLLSGPFFKLVLSLTILLTGVS